MNPACPPRGVIRRFVLLLSLCFPLVASLGAQSAGSIEGRVLNAANNTGLARARVTLETPRQEVLTDQAGFYRFDGVPAGEARLSVSYLGMRPDTATVTVLSGGNVSRDFALALALVAEDVTTLATFRVAAERAMSAQAVAMNEQRFAPNLKNVVSTDEFGDRGQENIGNLLLFLPGVAIGYSGIHPFDVSVRGLPSNTTGVTIDGGEVATTRDERSPNLRAVPMANIERVEVTKVPTPDASANGLGGRVNLITKDGLSLSRRELSYQANFLFHDSDGLTLKGGPYHQTPMTTAKWKQPSFDLRYSGPLTENIAIRAALARTWRMTPLRNDNDRSATWDLVKGTMLSQFNNALIQTNYTLSAQLGFDWRLSPTDSLAVDFSTRSYKLPIARNDMTTNFGAGVTGNATFSQGAATAVGFVQQGENWREEGYDTDQFSVRYKHRGPVWRMEAQGSVSDSTEYNKDREVGMFRNALSRIDNIVIRAEDSDGIMFRKLSAVRANGTPVDIYDGRNYSIVAPDFRPLRRTASAYSGRLDLSRDFDAALPFTVKVGLAADRKAYDRKGSIETYNFRPNGASDVTSRMAGNFPVFDPQLTGFSKFGIPYRSLSLRSVYELYQKNPSWFVLDEPAEHQARVVNSREYAELVTAAYARFDVRALNSKLWVVAGVRFERTQGDGSGPLDDVNAQWQRDASGKFILDASGNKIPRTTNALELRKLRFRERGSTAETSYSDFYPSVNTTYSFSENVQLRAAYARTIGRPNLSAITPGITISDTPANPTITVSNPDLIPWTANNYDLTLETYYLKDGIGSFGVFRKDIQNFFGLVSRPATPELLAEYGVGNDPIYNTYSLLTQLNSGDARVTGFEVGYRQALTFLPHWARGLQAFVNYTKINRSGGKLADFSGFTPESGSAGLSFARGRLKLSTTVTHRSQQTQVALAQSATVPADSFQYLAAATRWNINGEYSVNRWLSVFFVINDVEPYENPQLRYGPTTPDYARTLRSIREGSFTSIGVQGKF